MKMENVKIIASLTSFPFRISTVYRAVESILNQTVRLDKVILYLADEQFPEHNLPEDIVRLMREKSEFEVRWWPHDIKSYKKLVPALIEFPDDIIITFDDDILYPPDIVERLIRKHRKYPSAVCGCRVRRIAVKKGKVGLYKEWRRYKARHLFLLGAYPKFGNLATTGGGALFPPHSLHPEAVRDDIFMELCPTTDDLWFWAMAVLNNTRTAPAGKCYRINIMEEAQAEALANDNVRGKSLNDSNMKKILERYPNVEINII
jgi:hypothetical protein